MTTENTPKEPVGYFLPLSSLNEPMRVGFEVLLTAAQRARWTNAVTRKDGVETGHEADWIKSLVPCFSTPDMGDKDLDRMLEMVFRLGKREGAQEQRNADYAEKKVPDTSDMCETAVTHLRVGSESFTPPAADLAQLAAAFERSQTANVGVLQNVTNLAHCGGLIGMGEAETLVYIRRLTLPFLDKSASEANLRTSMYNVTGDKS